MFKKRIYICLSSTKETLCFVAFQKRWFSSNVLSAESASIKYPHFSKDVKRFYKKSLYVKSCLNAKDVLFKTLLVAKSKASKKTIIQTLLKKHFFQNENALIETSFSRNNKSGNKKTNQLIAAKTYEFAILNKQKQLQDFGFTSDVMSCEQMALLAFVKTIFEKTEGLFCYLEEGVGCVFLMHDNLNLAFHSFEFDVDEKRLDKQLEKIVTQIQWFLDDITKNASDFLLALGSNLNLERLCKTLFLIGPFSLKPEVVHYLNSSLQQECKRPLIEKHLLPFNQCHHFAIPIGLYFSSEPINFQKTGLFKRPFLNKILKKTVNFCFLVALFSTCLFSLTWMVLDAQEQKLQQESTQLTTLFEKNFNISTKGNDVFTLVKKAKMLRKNVPNYFFVPSLTNLLTKLKKSKTAITSFHYQMGKRDLKLTVEFTNLPKIENTFFKKAKQVNQNTYEWTFKRKQ